MRFSFCLALAFGMAAPAAHAVIVRGHVTTQLGQPLPGSRVQLIRLDEGARNVADTITGVDGAYELRTDLAGRFLLLTSPSMLAPQYAPQIGNSFYGGRTDVLTVDIALDASAIVPQRSGLSTQLDTPLRQLAEDAFQVPADQLLTRATAAPELRFGPGAFVVQRGQTGEPAWLLLRGAPVGRVLVDGIPAERLGGGLDLSPFTSSGLSAVASSPALEFVRGVAPLLGLDAQAGVLAFATPLASTLHPTLTYSGDAGGLSTVRNEGIASVVHSRVDALASYARFNTDNDLPAERLHLTTAAANLGYHISGNTSLRLTMRRDVSATPLPSPYALFLVSPATRLATQNLVAGFTIDSRTTGDWHNLLRYGLVRDRREALVFTSPSSGLPVTITGANGYSASGTALFPLPVPREDAVTNRDHLAWQTDYPVTHFLSVLFTASYQSERAADLAAASDLRLQRHHLFLALSLQGELKHRLFYEASGAIDHSSSTALQGAPRLGLTFVPVRPGTRRFRGTSLHLSAATGMRERGVLETAQLGTVTSPRSRTFDAGIEQDLLPRRLALRATYFHEQFAHQTETLNFAPLTLSSALAYRTQGLESELRYAPSSRLMLRGGYTYLASLVESSAAIPVFNPKLPAIPIGAATALPGGRLFDRPPSTGFATAEYTSSAFAATLKAAFSGRYDESTRLLRNPELLLPNRDLSPGFASLDASFSFNLSHAVTIFMQLDNLLDQRHIAPIGYLSTPFLARAGLRIRLGRE